MGGCTWFYTVEGEIVGGSLVYCFKGEVLHEGNIEYCISVCGLSYYWRL